MNFDRMRALLLDQAIRGELVPQLIEEGSIEQLGDRKGLFDIPKTWGWFEFSKVVKTVSSKDNQIPAKEISQKGRFPVVTQSKNSLIDGYSEEEHKLVSKEFLPLLVFGDHTRFLKYVDFQFIVGADGTKLIRPKDDQLVNCSYLYYVLKALVPETKDRGYSRHFQFLKKLMIPVPPLREQCRIVARVEKLLSKIDRAEKAYQELQTLSSVLRGQILQEAIQGKLVPQLDSEAEVQQIGDSPEEVPFAIPEKWKWINLKLISKALSDGSHNPPPNAGQGIPVLSAKNVFDGQVHAETANRWATEEDWKLEDKKVHIEKGDVLLTIVGTIGRTAVVGDIERFMLQRSVCVIKPQGEILDSHYLSLMLNAPAMLEWMMDRAAGTAQKGVYLRTLKDMPFPVPPVQEQVRIVTKVKELLRQVKALSGR